MAATGCGGKKKPDAKKPDKEQPSKPQSIESENSWAIFRSPKNERLWKVFWQSSIVTVGQSNAGAAVSATGDLQGVSGYIFNEDKVACTYSSQKGSVDKLKQKLILTGGVKLVATNPEATMFCDRMEYEGKLKIVKAFGHIRVLGTADTAGTIDELWATPDLKKLATPDMFYRQ